MGDRTPTADDISSLRYMHATILETLRFTAGAYLPRVAMKNDKIGSYSIKRNERILIPVFYLHSSTQYWEQPEKFNPDRFMAPIADELKFIYLPFSTGPRGCVGRDFALTQIKVLLALILQRYDFNFSVNKYIDPYFQYLDPLDHYQLLMEVKTYS